MIARLAFVALTYLTVATAFAVAAQPFPAAPNGFSGTAFRGISLGQSREEVEAALAALGKRCFTDAEVALGRTDIDAEGARKLYVESYDSYSTCRITAADTPIARGWAGGINLLSAELVFGMPMYAISFLDDRAAAISLMPEYFNSAGATPFSFAQSLIDNYPIDGFEPTESGWRGVTDKGELVQVWRGSAVVPLWVTIFMTTDANTPTFD